MSSTAFTPGPVRTARPGSTALSDAHRAHPLGDALRAVKVFVSTAFGVAVLGEYTEEAGVRTARHH
ncbi:hypothetical protein [Streptomyces uncialis]|uniref:hypothetical protein n=1 Tax=Streptomyces uncialis TaxID=1048205 RepID=UPI00386FD99F|nr:hypothetical protein OG924_20545 [Streptomyces uncialis]